jgi:hypothetical protein
MWKTKSPNAPDAIRDVTFDPAAFDPRLRRE